jgi:hypothetical protein
VQIYAAFCITQMIFQKKCFFIAYKSLCRLQNHTLKNLNQLNINFKNKEANPEKFFLFF